MGNLLMWGNFWSIIMNCIKVQTEIQHWKINFCDFCVSDTRRYHLKNFIQYFNVTKMRNRTFRYVERWHSVPYSTLILKILIQWSSMNHDFLNTKKVFRTSPHPKKQHKNYTFHNANVYKFSVDFLSFEKLAKATLLMHLRAFNVIKY